MEKIEHSRLYRAVINKEDPTTDNRIASFEDVLSLVETVRNDGYYIGWTGGSYNPLTEANIDHIAKTVSLTRELADNRKRRPLVIVGVGADCALVNPIGDETSRAGLIAQLSGVDIAMLWKDETEIYRLNPDFQFYQPTGVYDPFAEANQTRASWRVGLARYKKPKRLI